MKLILTEHKAILEKMIGSSIRFGLLPNLNIESLANLPDHRLYDESKDYQSFYSSHLVNLRMINNEGEQFWVTMAPGPDLPIEPWAPFWATSQVGFDSGGIKKDYSFYVESHGDEPTGDLKTIAQLENNFLNTYNFGFGLNRVSKWFDHEKITHIEMYDCNPYAACIINHDSGKEWCVYAEYDSTFWLNFSQDMINGVREKCELKEIIK